MITRDDLVEAEPAKAKCAVCERVDCPSLRIELPCAAAPWLEGPDDDQDSGGEA